MALTNIKTALSSLKPTVENPFEVGIRLPNYAFTLRCVLCWIYDSTCTYSLQGTSSTVKHMMNCDASVQIDNDVNILAHLARGELGVSDT